MQVDPIKPTSEAPRRKRLKVKCHKLLSISAFNFNLRRYTPRSMRSYAAHRLPSLDVINGSGVSPADRRAAAATFGRGPYNRSLYSST